MCVDVATLNRTLFYKYG